MVRKPIRQPRPDRHRRQGLRRQRGTVAAGGNHHGAATHEELVDGEHRLLRQAGRVHHHQDVGRARRVAVVERRRVHIEVGGEHVAQALELVALGLLHARHLLLHIGGDALRRRQRHVLQETCGEALQAFLDAAPQAVLVEGVGQRHLDDDVAVRRRQVEVEGIEVEQARGHRLESVVGGDLPRHFAVPRVRVDDLPGQEPVRLPGQAVEGGLKLGAQSAQGLRQPTVRGDVAGELHGLRHALEDAPAALEAV